MILKAIPLHNAIEKIKNKSFNKKIKLIYLSPQGKNITQNDIKNLITEKEITILCGKYKGIDERILKQISNEWSIGDFIVSNGESAVFTILNAISRILPEVLIKRSVDQNSFNNNMFFDYPNYTKPRRVKNIKIPKILISGNHTLIKNWREKKSIEKTKKNRPDLINKIKNTLNENSILVKLEKQWEKNEKYNKQNRKHSNKKKPT